MLFQEHNPDENRDLASEEEPIDMVDEEGKQKGLREIVEEIEEEKKWKSWEALFLSKELSSEETTVYKDTLEKVTGGDPLKKHYLNSRAEGRTDKQIAEELHVTTRTLRNWMNEMREREK